MSNSFLPILINGEEYSGPVDKKPIPGRPKILPPFEQARAKMINQIQQTCKDAAAISSDCRMNELVFAVKMSPNLIAKSYYPGSFIFKSKFEDIGSLVETVRISSKKHESSKTIFLKSSEEKLNAFANYLNSADKFTGDFETDIRSIESLFIPNNEAVITAFPDDWIAGRVEFVLYSFGQEDSQLVSKFFYLIEKVGINKDYVKYKSYADGPTFFSIKCTKTQRDNLVKFNPVRAAHPFEVRNIQNLQRVRTSGLELPRMPVNTLKSSILVGVFDGGVKSTNGLLSNYVTEYNPLNNYVEDDFLSHGTGVVGAILYGELSKYKSSDTLAAPIVNVESFRVLPSTDPKDIDLFEAIDVIENVVNNRSDINVYNLSFGPYGPIGTQISRFTYALDRLSVQNNCLFCVAVGNDGDLPDPENRRIQAPADIVNGLGVGAYTYSMLNIVAAPYSCIGPGREGAKVKPDIVDFGGCEQTPFHLIDVDGAHRAFAMGTSFASPLVAGKAAELMGRLDVADAIVARTLIIHSSVNYDKHYDLFCGYGAVPDTIEDILGCGQNKITVLYKGKILPTKYAKLSIPFIEKLNFKGKVKFTWTITVSTLPDANNTGDYTSSCIEETFYPNNNVYRFTDPLDKKNTKLIDIHNNEEEATSLSASGWVMSKLAVSGSAKNKKELELRNKDFKWDTVIKKTITKKYDGLDSPFLVIHGIERNNAKDDFINYAIAITIEYINCKENVYDKTLLMYNKLKVANLKSRNEVVVKVKQ